MKHSVTKTCFKALFCAYGIGILMTIGLIIANCTVGSSGDYR